ncbi:hypothetical protein [Halalkalibacterium ligniniphilum]|uniref:hypothetical protein n=1 Tax=Halalkalibacterium ligniniphilum TaxID=1134413 RepID=UPI0003483658|nr:hypothetical protein [Halalkalibacterium ligniniphilum]
MDMKKGIVIGSIALIAVLLIVGNLVFQQRVEETRQVGDGMNEQAEGGGSSTAVNEDEESEGAFGVDEEGLSTSGRVYAESNQTREEERSVSASESRSQGGSSASEFGTSTSNASETSSSNRESNGSSGNKQTSENNNGKSLSEIRQKYVGIFQQMEFQQSGKVNRLIAEAENEVLRYGLENVDTSKYRSRAQALEASADAEFYRELDKLKQELRANGHSEGAALEFQQMYEQRKETRRQELEARASGY